MKSKTTSEPDWLGNLCRLFNHHRQDYRTRIDRILKTISDAEHIYAQPCKCTVCIEVVDTFGTDTSIVVEVGNNG